ncbi:MAG TPA: TPM domain-containing protein [Thiobacillaceae bacterium]|nr:TPM domain-containing protein [Thiobacillaceae bacterium]
MGNTSLSRMARHLFHPRWLVARAFPRRSLDRITAAIAASESGHRGEIRFVVEGCLEFPALVRGATARQRAVRVFADLGVWDTEANSGVLVYLLLADRDVEILADRGLNGRVDGAEWEAICQEMETHFRRGEFEAGALAGIARIDALLRRHFPAAGAHPNELPDQPALL